MGTRAWDEVSEARKGQMTSSIVNIGRWANALLGEPTPLQAFSELRVPVLFMSGRHSPASSRGVARLLTGVLPRREVIEFEALGHMGPSTHPQVVNETICRFLDGIYPSSAPAGSGLP